jgi:hypothetical protein
MNLQLKHLAVATAGLALAGALGATPIAPQAQPAASPAAKSSPQHCFYASNINNFTTDGDKTVYLRVGVADVYRLDLMTSCPELTTRRSIGLERTVGGSNICSPLNLTVVFRLQGERRVCPVQELRWLTKDEIAALPKHDRP